MRLNRWSLDQIITRFGTVALIVLFVPAGLHLIGDVRSAAERCLEERGQSIARTLARQVIDPLLIEDRLGLYHALEKTTSTDSEIRYLCISNARGEVVMHTFPRGFPGELVKVWKGQDGRPTRFRTADGPLIDIPAPIMEGQMGTVHVGLSRSRVVKAVREVMWPMVFALLGALAVILVGAHVVAMSVSRPLCRLQEEVSRFPQQTLPEKLPHVAGTREVESLSRSFSEMAGRVTALEQERTSTQERMIHTERLAALGELAAGLAHEIHNPLDGMMECVRYLEVDPGNDVRATKYLPMIQEGLERIRSVMRQMLTLARGAAETEVEECGTGEMVDNLFAMLQGRLDADKVRLTWHQSGECVCLCNRHSLAQVTLNLVLNAAEAAAGSGKPEVRIEITCDAQWVYLAVEDSGPGVPPEIRERIFEPFFTTRPVGKGTGLGLSISRQLLWAIGGDLDLSPESSSLSGARFVVRLPKASKGECADE